MMNWPKCLLTFAVNLHAINYIHEGYDELWEISVLITTLGPIKLPIKLEPAAYQSG